MTFRSVRSTDASLSLQTKHLRREKRGRSTGSPGSSSPFKQPASAERAFALSPCKRRVERVKAVAVVPQPSDLPETGVCIWKCSIPEAGAKPSNAPASRPSAGTTCATLGRVGWCSEGFRSSCCRSWEAGSRRRWCGAMRTCRRRSMRAMRRRSIWSLRGIPTRAAAVYSFAINWHHEQCSGAMHVAGAWATQCPVSLSRIAMSKHLICLKKITTLAKAPVRLDCLAGQLPAYRTKLAPTSHWAP